MSVDGESTGLDTRADSGVRFGPCDRSPRNALAVSVEVAQWLGIYLIGSVPWGVVLKNLTRRRAPVRSAGLSTPPETPRGAGVTRLLLRYGKDSSPGRTPSGKYGEGDPGGRVERRRPDWSEGRDDGSKIHSGSGRAAPAPCPAPSSTKLPPEGPRPQTPGPPTVVVGGNPGRAQALTLPLRNPSVDIALRP